MNAPPYYARQKKRELKICYDSGVFMEALATLVILLHPLAALAIIREFFRQRKWRQDRVKVSNDARKEAVSKHEKIGNKIFVYVILVICLAFVSKAIYFQINNGVVTFSDLVPNHFHGWAGIIGLFFMIYLRKLGMDASKNRQNKKSYEKISNFHGRISDVMMYLVVIHAFLGFLYLFTYL
jgi:cytochrome b561